MPANMARRESRRYGRGDLFLRCFIAAESKSSQVVNYRAVEGASNSYCWCCRVAYNRASAIGTP